MCRYSALDSNWIIYVALANDDDDDDDEIVKWLCAILDGGRFSYFRINASRRRALQKSFWIIFLRTDASLRDIL